MDLDDHPLPAFAHEALNARNEAGAIKADYAHRQLGILRRAHAASACPRERARLEQAIALWQADFRAAAN
jgi:hypothetical protein